MHIALDLLFAVTICSVIVSVDMLRDKLGFNSFLCLPLFIFIRTVFLFYMCVFVASTSMLIKFSNECKRETCKDKSNF